MIAEFKLDDLDGGAASALMFGSDDSESNSAPVFKSREDRDDYYRSKYFAKDKQPEQPTEKQSKGDDFEIDIALPRSLQLLLRLVLVVFRTIDCVFRFTVYLLAMMAAAVIAGLAFGWVTA